MEKEDLQNKIISFFDKNSMISPFRAHEFLKNNNMREFSLINVVEKKDNLFQNTNEVNVWINKLKLWLSFSNESLFQFIQKVGTEFLLDTVKNHEELVLRIEVLDGNRLKR